MPYTVGERFLKPFLLQMFTTIEQMNIDMRKVNIKSFVEGLPLSNQTIGRRCALLASDLTEQTTSDLEASPIGHAFQSDASKDVDGKEQLVSFVR